MDGVADGGGIGRPVRRLEDLRFLIGKGRYSDDLNLPNQAHSVMVRSPHAHARIHSIDIRTAQRTPGTLAVLTGHDFLADGLNPIPFLDDGHPADLSLKNRGGSGPLAPPQPPIAIVAVAALPDQKPQIFEAPNRSSDPAAIGHAVHGPLQSHGTSRCTAPREGASVTRAANAPGDGIFGGGLRRGLDSIS